MENKDRKVAFITGLNGQDGSYLAEFLLTKGYQVHGLVHQLRGQKVSPINNIAHILDNKNISLHHGDISNELLIRKLLYELNPTEIYHLAGQSNIPKSFADPSGTLQTNIYSTVTFLELIKKNFPKIKFYFSSSSEVFGDATQPQQNELTPFNPNTPYGISKLAAYQMVKLYREKYGLFACSGICFNHESPRRSDLFVTRKITQAVARIKHGQAKELRLGNIETKKDWGFAGDFVEAMWLMLQLDTPEDFVIGTGVGHTVKEFLEKCFKYVNLDWKKYVIYDEQFDRKNEKNPSLADPSKCARLLNWHPKTSFDEMIEEMLENDLRLIQSQLQVK